MFGSICGASIASKNMLPVLTGTCFPDEAPRALLVDPKTSSCAALVRLRGESAAAYCSPAAPQWLLDAARASGALFVSPRPRIHFFPNYDDDEDDYASRQLPACTFGEAAHFARAYGAEGTGEYLGPEVTLRLAGGMSNSCFARSVLLCLRAAGASELWERDGAGPAVSDLPAAHEATARRHLRECLRQFDAEPSDRLVAAALHIVGRVMRAANERAPDLCDGRQHDAQEFALRLLRSLGHEPNLESQPGVLVFGAGSVRLADTREAGAPLGVASAAVAYAGNATSGHYTAHAREAGGGGWRELPDGRVQSLGLRTVLSVYRVL